MARERILASAYELFSERGIRAVGVDEVIAHAGVAKATLYRHFRSKDELSLAFLEHREQRWTRGWVEAQAAGAARLRRAAARDLRRVRRVVPPRGLRGLLVHQRPAGDGRGAPHGERERRPPREHPHGGSLRKQACEIPSRSRARGTSSRGQSSRRVETSTRPARTALGRLLIEDYRCRGFTGGGATLGSSHRENKQS